MAWRALRPLIARRSPLQLYAAGTLAATPLLCFTATRGKISFAEQAEAAFKSVELDRVLEKARQSIEARFVDPALRDVVTTLQQILDEIGEDLTLSADEKRSLLLNLLLLRAAHEYQLDHGADEDGNAAAFQTSKNTSSLSAEDQQRILIGARCAKFAAAAYGILGNLSSLRARLTSHGLTPPTSSLRSLSALEKWYVAVHAAIEPEDILSLKAEGSLENRAHLLAVDKSTESIILAIRGTFSVTDTVTDILCDAVPFGTGVAHRGMHRSAERLMAEAGGEITSALRDHPGYKLVLCGHSLGAGTAILMNAMLAEPQQEEPPKITLPAGTTVECYALAPPPVFGPSTARLPTAAEQTTFCFVNQNDIVPRLSVASVLELRRALKGVENLPLTLPQRVQFLLGYWGGWGWDGDPASAPDGAAPILKAMEGLASVRSASELANVMSEALKAVDAGPDLKTQITGIADPATALPAAMQMVYGRPLPAKEVADMICNCYEITEPSGELSEIEESSSLSELRAKEARNSSENGGEAQIQKSEDSESSAEKANGTKNPRQPDSAAWNRAPALGIPGKLFWIKGLRKGRKGDKKAEKEQTEAGEFAAELGNPRDFSRAWLLENCVTDHTVEAYEDVLTRVADGVRRDTGSSVGRAEEGKTE